MALSPAGEVAMRMEPQMLQVNAWRSVLKQRTPGIIVRREFEQWKMKELLMVVCLSAATARALSTVASPRLKESLSMVDMGND
jgi:hypothetical protein